eukprot:CAMPEP_0173327214 /NCGR_PEP_ID=MMETSP1144-20121109/1482_1 /TAXON_ID=483371 /ORGANISM="non described non described, Strain CCMP2298" /LENGTH=124 /DNA_ID=CAMNT_0014271581 /DNA_START=525 /DNA_END=899 /DNA_ORIENTATION=+
MASRRGSGKHREVARIRSASDQSQWAMSCAHTSMRGSGGRSSRRLASSGALLYCADASLCATPFAAPARLGNFSIPKTFKNLIPDRAAPIKALPVPQPRSQKTCPSHAPASLSRPARGKNPVSK